jgi:hypothetical protein
MLFFNRRVLILQERRQAAPLKFFQGDLTEGIETKRVNGKRWNARLGQRRVVVLDRLRSSKKDQTRNQQEWSWARLAFKPRRISGGQGLQMPSLKLLTASPSQIP